MYKIIFVNKESGRLMRHRFRKEDNIKKDMRERGCEGVNWITLAQDNVKWRLVWIWKLIFAWC